MRYLDEEHKNDVWNENEKSISNLAKKILKDSDAPKEEYEDWHQELLMVAFKCLNKWSPDGKAEFTTFAYNAMVFHKSNLRRKWNGDMRKHPYAMLNSLKIKPSCVDLSDVVLDGEEE